MAKPTEEEIRAAIRVLAKATTDGCILDADDNVGVFIVPAILGNGRIQYQVSDGLPGKRSTSFDFSTYAAARHQFNSLVAAGGWSALDPRRRRLVINDLCEQYKDAEWVDRALADWINDQPEHGRSKAPKRVLRQGVFEKIAWLVDHCEPPYSLDEVADFLVECQQP